MAEKGRKTTEQDVWCKFHGWVWPWHGCTAVEMTEAEERAALTALESFDTSDGSPSYEWGYSGVEVFTLPSGWQVAVFNDCSEWDYLEWITGPDGRQWEYPFETDRPMTERLSDWRPSRIERWVTNPREVDLG